MVASRLAEVRERIAAAGRDPAEVTVVAVTKGFGPEAVRSALEAGLSDIGENYSQELLFKAAALAGDPAARAVHWHYLGAIQRNKVAKLAPLVGCWQGLVRPEEAEEIARRSPGAQVLVEVDFTEEPGRRGCAPGQVAALVARIGDLPVVCRGLMTVAPVGPEPARRAFAGLTRLADQLGLSVRSMGMSDDYAQAVALGATMIRLGRTLFGERPARREPR